MNGESDALMTSPGPTSLSENPSSVVESARMDDSASSTKKAGGEEDVGTSSSNASTNGPVNPPSAAAGGPATNKTKKRASAQNMNQLLSEYPSVQKTTYNIITLLQNYGPLSMDQLEYNLPQPAAANGSSSPPSFSVTDIVDILHAIGVIRPVLVLNERVSPSNNGSASATTQQLVEIQNPVATSEDTTDNQSSRENEESTPNVGASSNIEPPIKAPDEKTGDTNTEHASLPDKGPKTTIKYSLGDTTFTFDSNVAARGGNESSPFLLYNACRNRLKKYHDEIDKVQKRCRRLEQALAEDENPKTVLEELANYEDTGFLGDPVYQAALKNCGVNDASSGPVHSTTTTTTTADGDQNDLATPQVPEKDAAKECIVEQDQASSTQRKESTTRTEDVGAEPHTAMNISSPVDSNQGKKNATVTEEIMVDQSSQKI